MPQFQELKDRAALLRKGDFKRTPSNKSKGLKSACYWNSLDTLSLGGGSHCCLARALKRGKSKVESSDKN